MAQKTYPITQYLVYPPAAPGFGIFPLNSSLYAKIECWGPAGETTVVEYLRPDTGYPFDFPSRGGPVPNQYDPVTDIARVFRLAREFRWDNDLLASGMPHFATVDDQLPAAIDVFTRLELLPQTATAVPDVLQWLMQNPAIADWMLWQIPGSLAYGGLATWSAQQKQDLASAFAAAWNSVPSALPDPPPSLTNDPENIVLSATDAWGLYLELVAHSLALEIGGRVPWSLTQLVPDDRARVLSAGELFHETPGGYWLKAGELPASPLFVYSFLRRNDLVGSTRIDTIVRILAWCRRYLWHYYDDPNDTQTYWQYPGVPDRRVIEGTVATSFPEFGRRNWTAGCTGTSGFLKNLLRVVNIPAEKVGLSGHMTIAFTSESRWLSHGDDPYNAFTKAVPEIPPVELLIDQTTFQNWFGPAVPAAERLANVGRRAEELGVQYLPDYLLHQHWEDTADGLAPADSTVYKDNLEDLYPNINSILSLWPAMDQKLLDFGRMSYPILRFRLPLWLIRFMPPWVPVLLQRIPLLWIPSLVREKNTR